MLVDSHCHLDYLERDGRDLEEVVGAARRAGIERLVTICTKVTQFETVRAIAERFEDVTCSVGIHPHEAGSEPETTTEQLVAWARHPKVVGIGETGLDYFYEHSPRGTQQKSFRAHIRAARETGLPLIVHTRDADEDTIAILREEHREGGPFPGVIHCFSSSKWLGEEAVKLGLYISISGILTFKKAEELRDAVRDVPLDRLLVETDSPYLAPVPKRGKQNEPAFVVHTAEALAALKDVSAEELAEVTTRNFRTLFAKAA
ncbi:TatD family hydrolase [Marivibrio halodurans]|uniref:TatD family hydrolase n=1 Tax=Marivibrio halodurans TaxID=2039722 RepID=A0A8J7S2P0_9PROT|nr:TatD family hydrolase [Marivibrio halodurans]MBP5855594.1 TatD family hydrolase [Marivibrio halodurans]